MAAPSFANFDLLILLHDGRYQARVVDSPVGEAAAEFAPPFTAAELRGFTWLPRHVLRDLVPARAAAEPTLTVRELGRRLYGAAFAGEVGQCLVPRLRWGCSGGSPATRAIVLRRASTSIPAGISASRSATRNRPRLASAT